MRAHSFGLVLVLASCGDSATVEVETPRTTRVYGRGELRAQVEERFQMRVGQLGTARCYLDVDREEKCGPATYEPCLAFEMVSTSTNIEVMGVVQVIGEPARAAFIARAVGSGQLVLHAVGIEKSLIVEVTEPPEP